MFNLNAKTIIDSLTVGVSLVKLRHVIFTGAQQHFHHSIDTVLLLQDSVHFDSQKIRQ